MAQKTIANAHPPDASASRAGHKPRTRFRKLLEAKRRWIGEATHQRPSVVPLMRDFLTHIRKHFRDRDWDREWNERLLRQAEPGSGFWRPWAVFAYACKQQYGGVRVLVDPWPWRRGAVLTEFLIRFGIWMPLVLVHGAVVWNLGRRFGLPQLFWDDNGWVAFGNGVVSALLFGLGVFLFFLLDYSQWLEDRDDLRERIKAHLEDKKKERRAGETEAQAGIVLSPEQAGQLANTFTNGLRHWTKSPYELYKDLHPKDASKAKPNEGREAMAWLQSHLFRSLFLALILVWAVLWIIARWVVHVSPVHEVRGFEPGESNPWMLPAGFALGLALVMTIDVGKIKIWFARNGRREGAETEGTSERGWEQTRSLLK